MSYVAACSIYSLVTDVRQTHLPCLYVPFTDHEEMVLTDIRKKKRINPTAWHGECFDPNKAIFSK